MEKSEFINKLRSRGFQPYSADTWSIFENNIDVEFNLVDYPDIVVVIESENICSLFGDRALIRPEFWTGCLVCNLDPIKSIVGQILKVNHQNKLIACN